MGKLLCEKNLGTFGVEMRAYGQKLVKFCTHTRAAKLVVEMDRNRIEKFLVRAAYTVYIEDHMLDYR